MSAALAVACGPAAPPAQVSVTLGDYSLRPAPASVAAGQVEFVAQNSGAMAHEVVVLKSDLPANALKTSKLAVVRVAMSSGGGGHSKVDEDVSGQLVGEIEDIGAGVTKRGTFQLTPGKYVLFCNLPGHYQLGMTTALEVH